jgi:hypothetical protein
VEGLLIPNPKVLASLVMCKQPLNNSAAAQLIAEVHVELLLLNILSISFL